MNNINVYRLEMDENRHPILIQEKEYKYNSRIRQPQQVVDLFNKIFRMRFLAEETLCLLVLDTKAASLGVFAVSHGSLNYTVCNPREIFLRGMIVGGATIIVVHNHPSGDCEPSQDDILCARKLQKLGTILGLFLSDFIIVGGNTYKSFKEDGII